MKKVVTVVLGAITLLAPLAIGAYCLINGALAIITGIAAGTVTAELIVYGTLNIIAGSLLTAPNFMANMATVANHFAQQAPAPQQVAAPQSQSAKKAA